VADSLSKKTTLQSAITLDVITDNQTSTLVKAYARANNKQGQLNTNRKGDFFKAGNTCNSFTSGWFATPRRSSHAPGLLYPRRATHRGNDPQTQVTSLDWNHNLREFSMECSTTYCATENILSNLLKLCMQIVTTM